MRFERGQGVHGQALFTEIKDHATGDAIKAGECRAINLVAKTIAPFASRFVVHGELAGAACIEYLNTVFRVVPIIGGKRENEKYVPGFAVCEVVKFGLRA
jgi:hypothetical protein